jgi:hypothetical protein
VSPQDGETDEQRQERENTNAARAVRRQKELAVAAQVQANHQLTPVKSTPTSGNKHLRHQLPHNSDAKIIYLVPTDCVQETSSGISSVTDSKFTIHRKPTWEPSLPL